MKEMIPMGRKNYSRCAYCVERAQGVRLRLAEDLRMRQMARSAA